MIRSFWPRARSDVPTVASTGRSAETAARPHRPWWQGLRLRAEVAQWRIGAGWGAMALVVAALAAWAAAVAGRAEAEEAVLQRLAADVARLEGAAAAANAASGAASASGADLDPGARTAALRQVLGDPRETTATLIRLYQLAEARQLAVRQAEFSQPRPRGGIGRLQVVMPIKGGYPQLRGFIDDALRAFPNLSLDRVTFKRNQVGQEQLESALHLSLWLREGNDTATDSDVTGGPANARPDAPTAASAPAQGASR